MILICIFVPWNQNTKMRCIVGLYNYRVTKFYT